MDSLLSRLTVGDVLAMSAGKDPNMTLHELFVECKVAPSLPSSGAGSPGPEQQARPSSAVRSDNGFSTVAKHFKVTNGGATVTKVGKDGQWNTCRVRPGVSLGYKKYFEFHLKRLKKGVNHKVVLGITQENMPKDNFLGTSAFSWGYGSQYGHVYHKAADIDFAEQAKQGDTVGVLLNGDSIIIYKNGKKLGKAPFQVHGTGSLFGAVSLLHEDDCVTYSCPEPPG